MRKTGGTMFRDLEFLSTFADPVTLTLIATATVVSAGAAVATGIMNYEASQRAADASRSLRNEQASRLKAESDARATAAATAAASGQTFGQVDSRTAAAGGFGFGTGDAPTGLGRGSLTGPD